MIIRYFLYVLQIILICVLLVGFFVFSQIDEEIDNKIMKIQREKNEFQEVKKKLVLLKKQVKENKIRIFNKEQAMKNILNTANLFFKNYNVKILEDIKDENKTLTLKMSLEIPIKSKNELKNLLINFTSSKDPFIKIQKFEVKKDNGTSFLNVVFNLIQVYKG